MNPMWDWLAQNSSLVQASVGGITALVWIVYLQILVIGFRRQRRTEILIHLGGSQGLDARTFISNLGFEPIYILEIILTIWSSDGERETFIADRTEIAKEDLSSPSATTCPPKYSRGNPTRGNLAGGAKGGGYIGCKYRDRRGEAAILSGV